MVSKDIIFIIIIITIIIIIIFIIIIIITISMIMITIMIMIIAHLQEANWWFTLTHMTYLLYMANPTTKHDLPGNELSQ